ncbi:hypothetical protein E2C01_014323 [Portunus trituberculatus]|uniref:Uncharacterized protein n=1 Tax=Portunus trituberculatus TaxID=210409 RepID=A0A5B7DIV9_PORTR|nr:hypothetical protein [Portunus trituberculatus]
MFGEREERLLHHPQPLSRATSVNYCLHGHLSSVSSFSPKTLTHLQPGPSSLFLLPSSPSRAPRLDQTPVPRHPATPSHAPPGCDSFRTCIKLWPDTRPDHRHPTCK